MFHGIKRDPTVFSKCNNTKGFYAVMKSFRLRVLDFSCSSLLFADARLWCKVTPLAMGDIMQAFGVPRCVMNTAHPPHFSP